MCLAHSAMPLGYARKGYTRCEAMPAGLYGVALPCSPVARAWETRLSGLVSPLAISH